MLDPIPIIKSFYFSDVIMWHVKCITTAWQIHYDTKKDIEYLVLVTKEYSILKYPIRLSPYITSE